MNMNRSRNPPPPTTITMTGTTTGTTTSGSKKKFGKNLNKLIKQKQQPTTPQINGLNSRSNGQSHGYSYRSISGSSLNHGGGVQMQTLGGGTGTGGGTSNLVLLSTKKKRATSGSSMLGMSISKSNGSGSNNVGNGASKNASSAGMTTGGTAHTATTTATASASASKSKSLLTSSSKVSSTHGALVNALNGSNRNGNGHHNMNGINNGHGQNFDYQNGDSGSHSAPPVAWGIEKVTNQKQSQQPQQQQQSYGDEKNVHYQQQQNNGTSHSKSPQQQQSQKSDNENQQTSPQPKSTSTSSQSTSKTPKATTAKNEEECKEDQVEFMKKLAKEKAMKMRQEEENRIQQQKERAALRLKELELKMARKSSANDNVNANSQPKRSLYDPTSTTTPSRTYSSLVGNHNHNNVPVKSSHHGNTNANGNGNGNSSDNHINGYGKESYNQHQNQHQHPPPTISTTTEMSSASTNAPPMPMIHLSSYDDRDRGMVRSANSGPRMLFDPKSGSMVAVTSRDENKSGTGDNGNSGGNGDRERGGSSKGRREKGKSKSSRLRKDVDNNGGADEDGMDIKSSKLRNKSKKEKRREEKKRIKNDLERRRKSITSSTQERNTNGNNHGKRVRIPRTKGVLYKRDEKGNLVSADGCEGDQGYGAHSVAGGRIRNPKGYMALKKKLQEENEKYSRNFPDTPNNQEFIGWHQQYDYPGQSTAHIEYEPILAKTLNRSHFMRKSSSPKQNTEKKEEINIGFPTPVRITADEKLELLTGMDESPTLQATAAAWAPSEAALALAAANVNQNEKDSNNSKSSDDNSETDVNALENAMALIDSSNHGLSDDEGSQSLRYGLGFDPKDMDAVMMSPDFISTDNNISDSAIVPDLIFKADNPVTTSSKNPFATDTLLGTSPWGGKVPNSVSMGSLTNWDYLNTKVPKESTTDMSPDNTRAKSFLSLSGLNGDTNTWGTGGGFVSGFNGIDGPLFGSSHTKGTKD